MDVLNPKQRSYCMSRIKSKDTTPELIVRKIVHRLGFRFRLHRSDLPGCPDIVLPRHKKLIFVHGCWWHRHNCRNGKKTPKTRKAYWFPKLKGNKERHKKNRRRLQKQGWRVLTIWECQTRNSEKLISKLKKFLVS